MENVDKKFINSTERYKIDMTKCESWGGAKQNPISIKRTKDAIVNTMIFPSPLGQQVDEIFAQSRV